MVEESTVGTAMPDEEGSDGDEELRQDIAEAIEEAPPRVRHEITSTAVEALNMLNFHLPTDELVELITSLAPHTDGVVHDAVLAITDRRLVFVGPGPRAIAWPLRNIRNVQHVLNAFQVTGDGLVTLTSFGLPQGKWADDFRTRLNWAIAEAILGAG